MSFKRKKGLNFKDIPNQYTYDLDYDYQYYYDYNANKKKKGKITSIVICVIFANIAVAVLYCVKDMNTIKASADAINNYASQVIATPEPEIIEDEDVPVAEEPVEPTPTPTPEMLESLKPYYEKNNDLIGWLTVADTPINNPVMFTPQDECYYLEKDFDGNYFKAGTLFIDDESRIGESDTNIIIYGHNMKNQTMFGSLKKYANYSYYAAHRYITFNTLYEEATYEVMAAFYAKVLKVGDSSFKYYQYTGAQTQEEHDEFINYLQSVALYETNITPDQCQFGQGDRYITLSTCSYHTENGRFVVVAKKID